MSFEQAFQTMHEKQMTLDAFGNSPVFTEARDQLRTYCIGFVFLNVSKGKEDGHGAGSGTLVSYAGQKGILTAAHVVEKLSSWEGEIGIVRYPPRNQIQKLKLNMEHVQSIPLGSAPWGESGPDLALLVLPFDTADALSLDCSFASFDKQAAAYFDNTSPPLPHFYALAGMIEERTTVVENNEKKIIKRFEASFEPGEIAPYQNRNGFDVTTFDPQVDGGYEAPRSYEGMSGAALFRIYLSRDEQKVQSWSISGVAFWQTNLEQGKRSIFCHGPVSIYEKLLPEVATILSA